MLGSERCARTLSDMATNRRIRRKQHRLALTDVLAAVSLSYPWRARLHESGLGVEHPVDAMDLDREIPSRVREAIRRQRLRYRAAWVPQAWTRGFEDYPEPEYLMFRVVAVEFPDIVAYSANGRASLLGRPWPYRQRT